MSAFFADMSFVSIRLARRTSSSRVRSGHAADRAQVEADGVLGALLGRGDRKAGRDHAALVVEIPGLGLVRAVELLRVAVGGQLVGGVAHAICPMTASISRLTS